MSWQSYDVVEQIRVEKLYTLFKMHFEKGYNFAGEMHDFWECMYVIDGAMCISADERVHNLSAGDMIVLKPLELHKFSVENQSGVTLFIFSFDMMGDFFKQMQSAYHLNKYGRSIVKTFLEYLDFEIKKCEIDTEQDCWNILPHFQDDNIFLQTVCVNICRIMLSLFDSAKTLNKAKTYETELFKIALDVMNKNIATSLSVKQLADSLNISVSGLKRLFERYAGMSVHKYFLTLKIKSATLMLKSGIAVSEVSDKLGFSSQGYFSATYKRETGNNPSHI